MHWRCIILFHASFLNNVVTIHIYETLHFLFIVHFSFVCKGFLFSLPVVPCKHNFKATHMPHCEFFLKGKDMKSRKES